MSRFTFSSSLKDHLPTWHSRHRHRRPLSHLLSTGRKAHTVVPSILQHFCLKFLLSHTIKPKHHHEPPRSNTPSRTIRRSTSTLQNLCSSRHHHQVSDQEPWGKCSSRCTTGDRPEKTHQLFLALYSVKPS